MVVSLKEQIDRRAARGISQYRGNFLLLEDSLARCIKITPRHLAVNQEFKELSERGCTRAILAPSVVFDAHLYSLLDSGNMFLLICQLTHSAK
jgi:hypothetical protein